MPLSRDQERVAQQFAKAIRKRNASPKLAEALFEAGLVESGLRNLDYGDRDSVGALQQRPSQGWKGLRNPYKAALEFIDYGQGLQAKGFKGSSGALAQAIQRSAFPDRYEQRDAEAEGLIARFLGGRSSSPGGGGGQQTQQQGPTATPGPSFGIQPGPGTAGLLAGLLSQEKIEPPVGQLRQSATAASAVLPAGYQGIQSSGAPVAPRKDLSALLEAVGGLGSAIPGVTQPALPGDAQNGQPRPGGGRPKGGAGSVKGIGAELEQLAAANGWPIGSGLRSPEDNARVGGAKDSDHLAGPGKWARDFPISGQQNIEEAGAAMSRALGLGGKLEGTIRRGKRAFRVQIITRPHGTGPHLHVGIRRA